MDDQSGYHGGYQVPPRPAASTTGVSGYPTLGSNEYGITGEQPPIIPITNAKPETTHIEPEETTANLRPKCGKRTWILIGIFAALLIIVICCILLWQFGVFEGKNEN